MSEQETARLQQIRERREKRRAPQIGTCMACGVKQEMMPPWQPIPSSLAISQWTCQGCGGQIQVTVTIGGDEPSEDEDIHELLEIVDAQAIALRTAQQVKEDWREAALSANRLANHQDIELTSLRADVERLTATKDDAYLERNHLVAALAHLFPSGTRATDIPGWSPDWHGCVTIDLPSGQISYHYHDSHARLFADLLPYTKPWDGHDKATVHQRLAELKPTHAEQQVRALCASIEQLPRHDLSVTAYYPEQAIPKMTVAEKVVKWAELSALLAAIKET